MKNTIQLFEKQQVRTVWDEQAEKWWFSVLDIIAILTDQSDYKKHAITGNGSKIN